MGLLSSFFKTSKPEAIGISGKLLSFLTEVDTLYMEAYALKSIRRIGNSLSRDCALRLQSSVLSTHTRYFGDDKYRHTKWTKESETSNTVCVRKEVKFDNIKIAGRLSIAVATDYVERWHISLNGNTFVVTAIETVR